MNLSRIQRFTSHLMITALILTLTLFNSSLFAQSEKKAHSPEVGVLIEYIKLDHLTANKLLREFAPKAADAKELRDTLDALIEKGEADLLETVWVRAQNDHRAQTMSVREDIYPTEYDPPEIPNIVGNLTDPQIQKTKAPTPKNDGASDPTKKSTAPYIASAAPTAFETRNVGVTLEVDLIVSQDQKTIHISLAPEIVTRLAERYFTREGYEQSARGIEHISMPTFYTMKTATQLIVTPGNYNLLGFHTPYDDADKRIFVLLRADLTTSK